MEKRTFERIDTNLEVNFDCGNSMRNGTVTNISERGMFIYTNMEFPLDLSFDLHLNLENKMIRTPVTVKRIARADRYYGGIGVELLNPTRNYLEFIDRLKRGKEV